MGNQAINFPLHAELKIFTHFFHPAVLTFQYLNLASRFFVSRRDPGPVDPCLSLFEFLLFLIRGAY